MIFFHLIRTGLRYRSRESTCYKILLTSPSKIKKKIVSLFLFGEIVCENETSVVTEIMGKRLITALEAAMDSGKTGN